MTGFRGQNSAPHNSAPHNSAAQNSGAQSSGESSPCPCGGVPAGASFADCCEPLLANREQADTAERLMRSRYVAFVRGDENHLFRTWHPATRPDDVSPAPGIQWRGLRIVDTHLGGPNDDEGEVSFEAHFVADGAAHVLTEGSRFVRRAGRWVYVDGDVE